MRNVELYQTIRDFLKSKVDPAFIIVFGSYAKQTERPDSDIDIAFYSPNATFSAYDTFLLAQDLADLIGIEVDLVDLDRASTVFRTQIYMTGTVIFARDETDLQKQKMTALSMYAKLNESRKEILDNIDERGTIL